MMEMKVGTLLVIEISSTCTRHFDLLSTVLQLL